ncbi:hypothetical protein BPOR_0081g00090 [Botrytis porri]|uniref:Uncharacterized protein n=1 Tax=Botrytis porri TaxID=87229 RepID=A0A4Z1L002_9HELO|nr:hypothetical protein BPOR_0081g00090 [Botrytis porri]
MYAFKANITAAFYVDSISGNEQGGPHSWLPAQKRMAAIVQAFVIEDELKSDASFAFQEVAQTTSPVCSGDDPRTTPDHLVLAIPTSIKIVKISTKHGSCGACSRR